MALRGILLIALLALPAAAAAQHPAPDTLLEAASKGDARAQAVLGQALRRGYGVEQDFQQALVWLERSAAQDHPLGIYGLGVMYEYGQGVARDSVTAENLYRRAVPGLLRLADTGDPEAQVALGYAHSNGRGVAPDRGAGLEWYRRAAERGHPVASFTLGDYYERGTGVAEDWQEAVRWYTRSAEADFAPAQTALGRMQFYGRGIPADSAEGVRWYRRAAETGDREAQFRLGIAYETGHGVAADEQEAMRWFAAAAERGHEDAERRHRRLETQAEISRYAGRFAEVAAQHTADLYDLTAARGVAAPGGFFDTSLESMLSSLSVRGRAVVLYAFRNDTLEVWSLGGGAVAVGMTAISSAELDSLHQALRGSWGVDTLQLLRAPPVRGFGVKQTSPDPATADELVDRLSAVLFPRPVQEFLDRHLVPVHDEYAQGNLPYVAIVPTLGIGSIPFGALRPFGSRELLVERAAVVIAPSLHDVARRVDSYWGVDEPSVVVGNPSFPAGELVPLPGAEREAKAVAGLLGTMPLLGTDATKAAVLDRLGGPLLYLATHGVADADDPLDGSFLALSGDDGASIARWTAREIQHGPLSAILVVLSACQTGLGRSHDAGVIGLARAFQLSGTVQVAISLWSVNDLATADLMEAFMHALKRGGAEPNSAFAPGDVAGALRQAMLETRQKWPNPADWASFTIFGVSPPLRDVAEALSGSG